MGGGDQLIWLRGGRSKLNWDNVLKSAIFFFDGIPKSELREREAEVERLQHYRGYWDAANFKGMSEVGTLSVYLSNIKISIRTRSSPIWERSSRLHGETLRQPRRFWGLLRRSWRKLGMRTQLKITERERRPERPDHKCSVAKSSLL